MTSPWQGRLEPVFESFSSRGTSTTSTVTSTTSADPPLGYPPRTNEYTLQTLATMPQPGYLLYRTDPSTGARVTRVSDQTAFSAAGNLDLRNQYAKTQSWNSDGTYLMIGTYNPGFLLDGKTYKFIRQLTLNGLGDAQWHPTDPNFIWLSEGNKLVKQDVRTNTRTTVRTFSSVTSITIGNGEGSPDNSGRYWPIMGKTGSVVTLFVYDSVNDVITAQSSSLGADTDIDWFGISQSGAYVLVNYFADGSAALQGVKVFDLSLTLLRTLFANSEHGDLGYDTDGYEVWVSVDFANTGDLYTARLIDGTYTKQMASAWNAVHLSCRNIRRPGWVFLSHNSGSGNEASRGFKEIWAVRLDGTETVERWAQSHVTTNVTPNWRPLACPNREGTKVIWGSDWDSGSTTPSGPAYAYVADFPDGMIASDVPRDPFGVGFASTAPVSVGGSGSSTFPASRAVFGVFYGWGQTVQSLRIAIVTASGNICASVYSSKGTGTNAMPDARRATSGSIPCPAAGMAVVALDVPVTIRPHDYAALSADNATAAFARQVPTLATLANGTCAFQNTAHPHPTTAAATNGGQLIPLVTTP